jgi:hypothetical protein
MARTLGGKDWRHSEIGAEGQRGRTDDLAAIVHGIGRAIRVLRERPEIR